MLSFLAGMVGGEFSKEIRKLHEGVKDFNLDLNVLIRFILSNFGIKNSKKKELKRYTRLPKSTSLR